MKGLQDLFIYLKIFVQFLKVTFHLQLLQNIGYITCDVQYNLEPILIIFFFFFL